MPRLSQLSATVDRRPVDLIHARARRRSVILRLLPPSLVEPLLAPRVKRLRTKLLTGLLTLSTLILGAAVWLTLH